LKQPKCLKLLTPGRRGTVEKSENSDSKSAGSNALRVRVSLPVPDITRGYSFRAVNPFFVGGFLYNSCTTFFGGESLESCRVGLLFNALNGNNKYEI